MSKPAASSIAPNIAHERLGPAAEDGSFQEIRCEHRQLRRVYAPAQTMPAMPRLMPLHEEAEIEPRHLTGENFELRSEEEIVRAPGAGNEGDIRFRRAVGHPARHRHHRRDARPRRYEEIFFTGMTDEAEIAERPERLEHHARLQIVEHPAGADASGCALTVTATESGREGEDDSV